MNRKKRCFGIILILITAAILSSGCTESIPVMGMGGTPIYDENITHQKWYSEHQENRDKYLYNPENPFEWTLKGIYGGEEALGYCDTAIELDPEFALAYYVKGIAFFNLKRYNEAEECFQKAIEIDPQFKPLADHWRKNFR